MRFGIDDGGPPVARVRHEARLAERKSLTAGDGLFVDAIQAPSRPFVGYRVKSAKCQMQACPRNERM